MRKIYAFNELVERTMRSRLTGISRPNLLQKIRMLLSDIHLSDIHLFRPNTSLITHDTGYNPFFIHLAEGKYIETRTLVDYFSSNSMDPLQGIFELTTKNSLDKYLLRNTISLIIYQIILNAGVSGENLFNTHLYVTYDALGKFFLAKYREINQNSLTEFYQNGLKPFSEIYNLIITSSSSDIVGDYPLFCSKTNLNRYPEHNRVFSEKIIPALIQSNSNKKTIHIISLGCSRANDLQDIYEMLFTHKTELQDWQIILEGRDINAASLNFARELFSQSRWIEFRLLDTNLSDPDTIQEIINSSYDLVIFRKAAMYLDQDIQQIYRENLKSSYLFATNEFEPDARYRKFNSSNSEPAYILLENKIIF